MVRWGGVINANKMIRNVLNRDIGIAKGIYNPFTFKHLVQDHGDWDFKNTGGKTIFGLAEELQGTSGVTKFQFGSLSMSAEDFGNFHYGVVGKATNLFSETTLLFQAGVAQIKQGTSNPAWIIPGPAIGDMHGGGARVLLPPYGDDPADQKMIQNGFGYYDSQKRN